MAKTNTLENEFLKLIFQNVPMTLIGDAAGLLGSAVAGNFYLSLHTADPGEAGLQTTNEATYTSYARIPIVRSAAAWTVTNNLVENASTISFTQCSGGSNSITHVGIGTALSGGAGKLLYKGALLTPLAVSTGIIPEFPAGTIDLTED